jgi:DNA polymerase-3 subunit gamma/tau
MAQRGLISALVRELAMQSEWLDRPLTRTRRWRCASSANRCARALREKLQAAVARARRAGGVDLVDGVPTDSPALRESAARARAQQHAEQTMTSDPVVRELMSQFKTARIVPGSIKPVQRNPSP